MGQRGRADHRPHQRDGHEGQQSEHDNLPEPPLGLRALVAYLGVICAERPRPSG
jgi:hypothetical protein